MSGKAVPFRATLKTKRLRLDWRRSLPISYSSTERHSLSVHRAAQPRNPNFKFQIPNPKSQIPNRNALFLFTGSTSTRLKYPRRMFSSILGYFPALCGVVLVATSAGFSQGRPSVIQSWNEVQLIVPVARSTDSEGNSVNKITAIFNGIARFGRDADLTDGRGGIEFNFRANKHITLVTSALYRGDAVVEHVQQYETRLAAGATFSATWKQVSFRDRNLYEYRVRSGRNDISVYRHRFQASFPVKHKGKILFSPFLSEEAFFDFSVTQFNNNELFLGVTRRLNSQTELDIAYIRNDTSPANINGLSLNLKITLP